MNEQQVNYTLIEHILTLLKILQMHHIEIDQLMENHEDALLHSLPESQEIRTAYELMAFMDEMPGGFLIYYADDDEQIIYANKALLRIFGCDTLVEFRELTGNSFKGVVHPDDLADVEESVKKQIASNRYELDYVEYRILRKDGEIRWIEDYGHFIHSETIGDIFYVFLGDATEKKKRQRYERETLLLEKKRNEEKLQSLIEEYDKEKALINQEHLRRLEVIEGLSINYESICYADLHEDKIIPYRLSSRTTVLFGEKFQVVDLSWYLSAYIEQWVHPEDRPMVTQATNVAHICSKLQDNDTYYINYRAVENGQILYLQLRLVNVGSKERITQIVMGYRRVDEELQKELEQKQMLAEALNDAKLAIVAKNTFLSNMSHDMRTPLNAIFGFTALAKKDLQNTEVLYSYLEKIETSGKQLLELIDKVLEISWTGAKETPTKDDECDLSDIMWEVYEFLHPQAMEKNIAFSLDCSGIIHNHVYSDSQRLKQLVLYLGNNAVTYTKEDGKVSMTLTETEALPNHYATYQLVVEDNGVGISEEFLEQIFEPFTREKNTTLSGVHGVGLGLTIVKNIVDMMDGTIEAKSTVGMGSTFVVKLCLRQQVPSQLDDQHEISLANAHHKKILLVEDNELNREIETEILGEMGFLIETAEDGSIAVEKMKNAHSGDYDLILMDIQMPVMNGWQAAKIIRKLPDPQLANIPIIALSANVFESDIQMSMECGMNAHLAKPIDILVLSQTIEEII